MSLKKINLNVLNIKVSKDHPINRMNFTINERFSIQTDELGRGISQFEAGTEISIPVFLIDEHVERPADEWVLAAEDIDGKSKWVISNQKTAARHIYPREKQDTTAYL